MPQVEFKSNTCEQLCVDKFDEVEQLIKSHKIVNTFYFAALIKPQPKQSTFFGKGHAFVPKNKRELLSKLAHEFESCYKGETWTNLCDVEIVFSYSFKSNKSLRFYKGRSDLDNLEKPCFDCLEGLILENDSQIVSKKSSKIGGSLDGIFVRISFLK